MPDKDCWSCRAAIMKLLNDHKQLGEKTGAGFYKFDAKRKASPNKDLAPLIAESRKVCCTREHCREDQPACSPSLDLHDSACNCIRCSLRA